MITLFGIKNCDSVKKARKWLDTQSIDYQFHDFRADGISLSSIQLWLDAIGKEALINKRSTTWKSLSDTEKQYTDNDSIITLISQQPTLIKRPLLDTGKGIHVGFKADHYKTLFDQ